MEFDQNKIWNEGAHLARLFRKNTSTQGIWIWDLNDIRKQSCDDLGKNRTRKIPGVWMKKYARFGMTT